MLERMENTANAKILKSTCALIKQTARTKRFYNDFSLEEIITGNLIRK